MAIACATAVFAQPAPAPPSGRGAAQGPRVVSPEILPDKRVIFRLVAPKAAEVLLNGNWDNGRNIKMTKDDAGIWSVTVDPLGEQLWGGIPLRAEIKSRHNLLISPVGRFGKIGRSDQNPNAVLPNEQCQFCVQHAAFGQSNRQHVPT